MLAQALRGLILNHSSVAAELTAFRVATGYDGSYRAHCRMYRLAYYDEAVADGYAVGEPALPS